MNELWILEHGCDNYECITYEFCGVFLSEDLAKLNAKMFKNKTELVWNEVSKGKLKNLSTAEISERCFWYVYSVNINEFLVPDYGMYDHEQ